jgi:hypothetical protein
MKGFKSNIEKDTLKNENFRKVLYWKIRRWEFIHTDRINGR